MMSTVFIATFASAFLAIGGWNLIVEPHYTFRNVFRKK